MPLDYTKQIIDEIFASDCLHIIGRGLGLHKIIIQLLRAFCDRGQLVFLLNVNADEESYFLNQLKEDGVDPLPRFMRSDFSIRERTELYLQGGCLLVNPRNLVVDLLQKRVPTHLISGFLVNNAHRVDEDSAEAFILRLFREKNRTGFIKAFSQSPEHFSTAQKLGKVMRALQVQTLHLWPRFRMEVIQSIECRRPDVVEICPRLTDRMAQIQGYVTDIMAQVLSELQTKSAQTIAALHLSIESVLSGDLFKTMRDELGPSYHTLPVCSKRLLEDLRCLKDLLVLLYTVDCVAFFQYLENLIASSRSSSGVTGLDPIPAEWVLTSNTSKLMATARERVFMISRKRKAEAEAEAEAAATDPATVQAFDGRLQLVLEADPKWEVLSEVLAEIQSHRTSPDPPRVLVLCSSERTRAQLSEYLCTGGQALLLRQFRRHLLQKYPATADPPTGQSLAERVLHAEARAIRGACDPGRIFRPPTDGGPIGRMQLSGMGSEGVAGAAGVSPSGAASTDTPSTGSDPVDTGPPGTTAPAASAAAAPTGGGKGASKAKRPKKATISAAEKVAMAKEAAAVAWGAGGAHPEPRGRAFRRPPKGPAASGGDAPAAYLAELQQRSEQEESALAAARERQQRELTKELEAFFGELEEPWLQLHTYKDTFGLLPEFNPQYIVMYDADLAFIRRVELYVNEDPARHVRVYLLAYDKSAEQQKFLSSIQRELRAFQSLVKQKADLTLGSGETWGTLDSKEQELQTLELVESATNRKGGASLKRLQAPGGKQGAIVVDMREFRSALPSQLHARGFTIVPVTLEVGDYVLTPEVCVERKSVQDLCQSFNSGRLFHQIEAMSRHYPQPTLLIEFARHLPFTLIHHPHHSSLQGHMGITERLTLLAIHFPTLRILWCRSPQVTALAFQSLKEGKSDPDTAHAAELGLDHADAAQPDAAASSADSVAAEDVLTRLPGVTPTNVVHLMTAFRSLRQVLEAPLSKLSEVIGQVDGTLLFQFLHRSSWDEPAREHTKPRNNG